MKFPALLIVALAAIAPAQTTTAKSVIGAISAFRAASGEIEIQPDGGAAVPVKVGSVTVVQKVAPGQTDLAKAETIAVTDLSLGDRVLVTFDSSEPAARRIVVVSANDLAARNAADRLDWTRRGVAGVVTGVSGNEIALESRSIGGAAKFTVTAGDKTSFKRYAPDSVRYSDAKVGKFSEIAVGDQLRARGVKSPDGTKVDAGEVVFGTFVSRAGTITAINAASGEVTIKDLSNNKPLIIKLTADSQVKRMPDMAAMAGQMGRGVAPPPAVAAAAAAKSPAPAPRAAPDLGQVLESLPALKIADLKTSEIIVVSAIKGARADQVTAVTLLANAETLVQLAMQARGAGATGPAPSLAGLASSISSVGP